MRRSSRSPTGPKPRASKATTSLGERFAREYVVDLNATEAVIRAGYSWKSRQGAANKASKLLHDPVVAALIADLKAGQFKRLEVNADRVLEELARMAYLDPGDLAKAGINGPGDIAALPEDVRRAVVGWSWDASGNFVIKWAAKQAALEALGRHLKLFTDRIEVKDVTDRATALARARARALQARPAPAGQGSPAP
jgi:phage terminase small subunit